MGLPLTGQTPGFPDNTYKGLINLEGDDLGLTGTLRNLQDGLGNNSGIELSTSTFQYSGIFVFASKTASTLIYLNASKQVTSLAAGSNGDVLTLAAGLPAWAAASSLAITIGTTPITSGASGRLLFESATNKVSESANLKVNFVDTVFEIGYDVFVAENKQLCVGSLAMVLGAVLQSYDDNGTDQFRAGWDDSNFFNLGVDSTGNANLTLNGSGNPIFTFYNPIYARVRPRAFTQNAPGATPGVDSNDVDFKHFTGLNTAITSMTTNLGGVPTEGQKLWLAFTDNGTARAITWGASFENGAATLPTTTVASTRKDVGFIWNTVTSKWRCVAAG